MTDNLKQEAEAARQLVAFLKEKGLDDEETVDASIESETDLKAALSYALAQLDETMALRAGAVESAKRLRERADRFDAKCDRIHTAIHVALDTAGQKSLKLPEATLSIRAGVPSVRVIDENEIPAEFWLEKTDWQLDRKKVAEALKAKQPVPGATLSNPQPTLAIRRS
jgi:hypothetical protein